MQEKIYFPRNCTRKKAAREEKKLKFVPRGKIILISPQKETTKNALDGFAVQQFPLSDPSFE
jgi:hypothetical protein